MTNSPARTLILIVALSQAFVLVWTLAYPSESDPKNIKYVLWKIDLYPMNLDNAMGTMIGDPGRRSWLWVNLRCSFEKVRVPRGTGCPSHEGPPLFRYRTRDRNKALAAPGFFRKIAFASLVM